MKLTRILAVMSLTAAAAGGFSADWAPTTSPLMTRWGKQVTPENAWREYPRPQLKRENWLNLNGLWDIALRENAMAESPVFDDRKILVPYPVEAPLSGIGERANHVVYRREFSIPDDWKDQRVLLHFDAVDWQTTVTVNGSLLKTLDGDEVHEGGYDRFSYDLTDVLKDGANTLQVSVFDPTEKGQQPRGKQVTESHGIWYTPTTGIWQTVWLEPVAKSASIQRLKFTPDAAEGTITVGAELLGSADNATIDVSIKTSTGTETLSVEPGSETTYKLENRRLWSPDDPFLYEVTATLKSGNDVIDVAESYFGLRDIEIRTDGEFTRIYLNSEEIFQFGTLDQGFWPDGVHTPPSVEAMNWDIDYTRELGFNLIRKHIKVEPDLWYYHCDKTGMLVWQDAVNGEMKTEESHKQFERDLDRMITNLYNSPSVVLWVVFNEDWGQYDTERITAEVQAKDPTRLVTNASGWVDKGVGHIFDQHQYPGPGMPPDPDPKRASVLGEFGGLGLFIEGHSWGGRLWGYQNTHSREEFMTRVTEVVTGLPFLKEIHGLNAAVYTQITDVEIEANGFVTYDREEKKLDSGKVRELLESVIHSDRQRLIAATSLTTPKPEWQFTTEKPGDDWASPDFAADAWTTGAASFGVHSDRIFSKIGTEWNTPEIWLRRNFDLPADAKVENLQIMAVHAGDAEVYINGTKAADIPGFYTGYVPVEISSEARAALKPGQPNTIAVHCRQLEDEDARNQMKQMIDVGIVEILPEN